MRFEIVLDRVFRQPPEKVWQALTRADLLRRWLMETDLVPEVGRAFTMSCEDGQGGTDRYLGRVLACEPPRRMLWSWALEGEAAAEPMRVEFVLEPVAEGTRLTVRHSGDRPRPVAEAFRGGWPAKLDALEEALR